MWLMVENDPERDVDYNSIFVTCWSSYLTVEFIFFHHQTGDDIIYFAVSSQTKLEKSRKEHWVNQVSQDYCSCSGAQRHWRYMLEGYLKVI